MEYWTRNVRFGVRPCSFYKGHFHCKSLWESVERAPRRRCHGLRGIHVILGMRKCILAEYWARTFTSTEQICYPLKIYLKLFLLFLLSFYFKSNIQHKQGTLYDWRENIVRLTELFALIYIFFQEKVSKF